jgi:sugar/nucleoside kinase (ribokinase family)
MVVISDDTSPAGRGRRAARVLCAGIAVMDFMFRVDRFPTPSTKAQAHEFFVTGGGCAANAAIAIARLGGQARFAGPVGDDDMSGRILDGLVRAGVDIGGVTQVAGAVASVSGIFIDAAGERLLTTRREQGLASGRPRDPERLAQGVDLVLADNRFPEFVLPVCSAARARGLRVVLDVDKPTEQTDPLLAVASHAIFSAEALRVTSGISDIEAALARAADFCRGFLAVTDGANGALWRDGSVMRHQPAFAIDAVDTLAAGDVFHGAFALTLAEGRDEAHSLRFASAAAALKCTRFGGIAGTPKRPEVERLLQERS